MKKIVLSLLLTLCLLVLPESVYAASCSSAITGTKSINVGGTTTLYVKVNASAGIKGADLNFAVSGNLKLVSASPVNLQLMGNDGSRYIMYAMNPVNSGSNIFAIKVKGTAKGTGTVSVKSLEATVDDQTATCTLASATVTVNEAPKKTTTTTPATTTPTTPTTPEEPKEEVKQVEVKDKDYEDALRLVEQAEKTKKLADVKKAKEKVDELKFSEKKYDLTNRLYEIKIDLNDNSNLVNGNNNDLTKITTDVTGGMSWFFLAAVLLICLVVETIYLMVKESKKKEVEEA